MIGAGGPAEIIAEPSDVEIAPRTMRARHAAPPGRRLAGQLGWVTGSFMYAQVLRLFTNVVLARLLAPQLFGIMLIINTLRTGIELLSDIGVGQNIVSNPKGNEPAFFNTAWTLQLIRGVVLALGVLAFSGPIAAFYGNGELRVLVPLMAVLFLLTGFQSPAHFLLQKRGETRRYTMFDMARDTVSLIANIGLALYTRTIWALLLGLIFSTMFSTLGSYVLLNPRQYRLTLDRRFVREILTFGKWVFASSLVFFLAMNFDRLYFAKVVPFAVLGVYGVARTFSDAAGLLVQRIGNLLIYPKIAASGQTGPALRTTLARVRGRALLAIAALLSVAVAGSDRLILILYDTRYHAAAFMLPILMAGVWFSILSTLGEAIMLGTGRPAHAARANAVKLVWTCVGLPVALLHFGIAGALVVIATADLMRYVSLALSQRAQHLSFARQDVALTLALAGMALAWRSLFVAVGLTPDFAAWWRFGASLHG